MRVRKDKMVKAIDGIIADWDKRQAAYDKAVPRWQSERRAAWVRDSKPRLKKLQTLIATNSAASKVVTPEDVRALGFREHNYGGYDLQLFQEDVRLPDTLVLQNGAKVTKPTGINIDQMRAMKKLLDAVEDDVVSDSVLARLGVKDVTPIFRAAVELGGFVS